METTPLHINFDRLVQTLLEDFPNITEKEVVEFIRTDATSVYLELVLAEQARKYFRRLAYLGR